MFCKTSPTMLCLRDMLSKKIRRSSGLDTCLQQHVHTEIEWASKSTLRTPGPVRQVTTSAKFA